MATHDLKSRPCENCYVQKDIARTFDIHGAKIAHFNVKNTNCGNPERVILMDNDLISRSELLSFLTSMVAIAKNKMTNTEPVSPHYLRYQVQVDEREEFRNLVANARAVDAVEIVRCEGCQCCLIDRGPLQQHVCIKDYPLFQKGVRLDDFCSWGKPKEGTER